ncbi:hem peroxidase [Dillenia turbinata]|uniref:Hem peroxidase n=1 Tax=Dillenia turbinata TaxID=194707 RepID=A0AAN8UYA3_9MAGN
MQYTLVQTEWCASTDNHGSRIMIHLRPTHTLTITNCFNATSTPKFINGFFLVFSQPPLESNPRLAPLSLSLSLSHRSSSSLSPTPLKSLRSSPLVSHLFLNQEIVDPTFASDPNQLNSAKEDIKELLKTKFFHPILAVEEPKVKHNKWPKRGGANGSLRFDIELKHAANAAFGFQTMVLFVWDGTMLVLRGGANGSLRFDIELKHAANAGIVNALKLLQPIKDKNSGVTYADLFQLASATAVEIRFRGGASKIPMKYERVDVSGPKQCPEERKLPAFGFQTMVLQV